MARRAASFSRMASGVRRGTRPRVSALLVAPLLLVAVAGCDESASTATDPHVETTHSEAEGAGSTGIQGSDQGGAEVPAPTTTA